MINKEYIKVLVNRVFEKARDESKKDSPYGLCKYLHEEARIKVSERNLTRYYNYFISGNEGEKINPDDTSLGELSKYLGYKGVKGFITGLEKEGQELANGEQIQMLKRKLFFSIAIIGVLTISLAFLISRYYRKNCMIWVEDHYEKIRCSGLENEKKLDKVVLLRMREIKDPVQCQHDLWYDKSDNQVRFFSYYGQHPTNGKTLKRVTEYICEKYILEKRDSVLAQNGTTVLDSLE